MKPEDQVARLQRAFDEAQALVFEELVDYCGAVLARSAQHAIKTAYRKAMEDINAG